MEEGSKVYFRTADSINSIIDYVTNEDVTEFKRNFTLAETEVLEKEGITRLDNNFEDQAAEYKIYAWNENGVLYWWTKADSAVLPANLDYYFQNQAGLTNISWTGIYKNGYWTGNIGEEQITTSITNMRNMFYGCIDIEKLDISWFNNSEITEETKANMKNAFGNNSEIQEGVMSELYYIEVGDKFKLFDTSILSKGDWENQITEERKKNTELIGILQRGIYKFSPPTEKVNYTTTLNNVTLDQWSVFYKDNEKGYTYIILDDYLPNSAISNMHNTYKMGTYGFAANTHKKYLIWALETKSNWKSLLKGTLNGMEIDFSEVVDENIYAMGSPTLDLWTKSWNTRYPKNMLISTPYYLSDKAGYYNALYFPHREAIDNNSCMGYWLASDSWVSNAVMRVSCSGQIYYSVYNDNLAVRPIICLPSNIFE